MKILGILVLTFVIPGGIHLGLYLLYKKNFQGEKHVNTETSTQNRRS